MALQCNRLYHYCAIVCLLSDPTNESYHIFLRVVTREGDMSHGVGRESAARRHVSLIYEKLCYMCSDRLHKCTNYSIILSKKLAGIKFFLTPMFFFGWICSIKVGLGIFYFGAICRRLILKTRFRHPISVVGTIYGTRFDLQDSERRAPENKFSMRICNMILISKCRGD